jgi:hypothetical protein
MSLWKHHYKKPGKHPWSKLGRDIKNLFDPSLPLQIHCIARSLKGKNAIGSTRFPRYWMTLNKEIIFDYPSHFMNMIDHNAKWWEKTGENISVGNCYPYEEHGVSEISKLIRDYIERPKELLFQSFENDKWGLTDIFRVADRRVGKGRLKEIESENIFIKKIIALRLNNDEISDKI